MASLVAEHGLAGEQAEQLWLTGLVALQHVNLLRPGIEPMSPAVAGGFLTPGPSGKS